MSVVDLRRNANFANYVDLITQASDTIGWNLKIGGSVAP
jgi:hypothetical protein